MFHRFVALYDRLLDAMAGAGAIMMVLMSLWVTYEVIARYAFNNATIWAVDLSEYALLWATFLASPWLVREGGHVQIESLLERLTPRQRHVLGVFSSLAAALVAAVMLWQGLDATLEAFNRGQMVARSWRVPRAAVWMIIPIGSFFLVIEFIRAAVRSAHATRDEQAFSHHAADERVI